MTCEIRNIVSFNALFSVKTGPLSLLGVMIERMKLQLNDEAAALKYIKIRPWFFADTIEPEGLVITLIGEQ